MPSPPARPAGPAALAVLGAVLLSACAVAPAAAPAPGDPILSALQGGLSSIQIDETEESFRDVVFELQATPRDGRDDDAYGFGFLYYPERRFGLGVQVQGTFRSTDPEVDVVLTPPAAELEGRDREFVFDVVGTYRLNPTFGVFGGVGYAQVDEYRRFLDAIGNDFFVEQDSDSRLNLTGGVHLWLLDQFVISAQWDSVFDAVTYGVGWQF